jgi:hypothetical protein
MRFLAAILTCLSTLSYASSTTTDYSDLWGNTNEAGWGANVIHEVDTLFVSLFIYGPTNQPVWYFASGATQVGTSSNFTGTLYQTTGPYFGAGSFPGLTSLVSVGTLTFTASGPNAATLTYSVNGVTVTKAITRNTFRTENIAGTYIGGSMGTWSNCGNTRNGYVEAAANYTVSHDGTSVQIREEGSNFQCNYTGAYTQTGRYGVIAGGGLCTDGINQTFTATEVAVSRDALTMKLNVNQIGGCSFAGRLGGMRRGP